MTSARNLPYLQSRVVKLLDLLLVTYKLRNDNRLARLLHVSPASLSSLRHGRVKLGATALYRIALLSDARVKEIKEFLSGETGELRLGTRELVKTSEWINFECSMEAAGRLFDHVNDLLGFGTDVQLADHIGVSPPTISNLRRGSMPLKPSVVVRIHEQSGLSLSEIFCILDETNDNTDKQNK